MIDYVIERGPAYSVLKVKLNPGVSITVEPGAYMLHKGDIEVQTSTMGVASAIARRLFGGESIFLNTFRARSSAEIWIAPETPGDIVGIRLEGGDLIIQDTSYLAHVGDIKLSIAWRGFKGLIAEGELIWLKTSGYGLVFVSAYGAIEELKLDRGEKMTVDNGHFVALDGTIKWGVRKLGGLKTLVFGGEGLVIDVEGPGRVWVQTRTLPALAQILAKYLRVASK
ncbi:MAG: TIGR00266 family protein [Acidilobaceae archaeon]